MPPRSFEEGLEFGRRGERLVESWLQSIGVATMPAYDFGGQGAPSIRRGTWRVPVPDILGMRKGRAFWFEVKTHEAAALNSTRKCHIHGVRERLWEGYKQIAIESGMSVFVLVLELDTGELRRANVADIATWRCECRPCKDGGPAYRCRNGGKQEVYFRRDDMGRLCTFSRAQCDAVRSEREAA